MSNDIVCSICLDDASMENDNCMIWWCEHIFHKGCLNKYMSYKCNTTCPICRSNIKNVVDLSDNVDKYIYKSVKENKNDNEEKIDILINANKKMELEKIVETELYINGIDIDDMRLLEEMIWFNF